MPKPFEGLFGDTSELRVIQFMLPLKGLEFNITEIARGTGVTRQTLTHIVKKLEKWTLLKTTGKHVNANYYAINEDSAFVEAFESMDNCIVEQLLGEEELASIANYAIEHAPISLPEVPQKGYAKDWASDPQEFSWMRFTPTESPGITPPKTTQDETPQDVPMAPIGIGAGEEYARA